MRERALISESLRLDPALELARIEEALQAATLGGLRRHGAVVGLSGGIDSSLTAALCARALGADRVLGLLMPEQESSADSLELAQAVADAFGIETLVENITGILEAAGAYERRNAAIRRLVPTFGDGWGSKIVLPSLLDQRQPLASARSSSSRRRTGRSNVCSHRGGLPGDRRRDQLQAADAEDARVLPRRSARVRRRRDAEPARARPGLLRQER